MIKINKVRDYGQKGGDARKGVNLPKGKSIQLSDGEKKAPVVTDPNRPPVGTTPSEDIQFVLES
jgi:hypothetical protein